MSLPSSLVDPIHNDLAAVGDTSGIVNVRSVGGGCINQVAQLESGQGRYLLKWNQNASPGMFAAEAAGLRLLRSAEAVRVPEVLAVGERDGELSYLLIEWIDPPRRGGRFNQHLLGEQLALMHRTQSPNGHYGIDHDNYIGSNAQRNGWVEDWVEFFREKRLKPQIELARQKGLASGARLKRLRAFTERLEQWLAPVKRVPSLLHGDLWGGNVIAGANQEPVLIDPAVFYGDREADLAFTELFGGFTGDFYRAYQVAWPLEPGYRDRRDIYNLYHLLNHLNLFGGSYGPQVDSVLQTY